MSPNSINSAPVAGFKFAKPGYNVETASDYELLFSSAWPSIAIQFDQTVTVPANRLVTVPHNLNGYFLTMAYAISDGVFMGGTQALFMNGDSVGLYIGRNNLYIIGEGQYTYQVNVKIYTVDITKDANYTYIAPPAAQVGAYTPHYGAKFAKSGKHIDSRHLNDFIFHTQAVSPAILTVMTEDESSVTNWDADVRVIQYTNPAGYTPWIFGFTGLSTTSYESLVYTPSDFALSQGPGLFFEGALCTLAFEMTNRASLVVLRDPLFTSTNHEVTY